MKKILRMMVSRYAVEEFDWMHFKITEENPLTYHHIKKKEEGGKKTIENGALLTADAQSYLHYIERKDINVYNQINSVLKK